MCICRRFVQEEISDQNEKCSWLLFVGTKNEMDTIKHPNIAYKIFCSKFIRKLQHMMHQPSPDRRNRMENHVELCIFLQFRFFFFYYGEPSEEFTIVKPKIKIRKRNRKTKRQE